MKIRRRLVAGLGAAILAATACSPPTADVTGAELRAVVESDAIVIDDGTVPDVVVDRLAGNRVVLLGETHHLREHWQFVASLLSRLYDHGFRQLLIEAPHMASWLLDDYVQGSPLMPDWMVTPFYDRRLSMIRDFNGTTAAGDPIHVRGVDANEVWYGGARDFQLLVTWFADTLPDGGPLGPFLDQGYGDAEPAQQQEAVENLLESLAADRDDLVDSWGADRYQQLIELLTVELASIEVRGARSNDDDDGARARENLIKGLVVERVDECRCGTVINIGGHHAQKSHLMGTEQEWLGDHLANTAGAVDGSVIVIGFASALTELEPGAGGTPWNVVESNSPDNELFRVMAETLPGRTVFLPLDDPLFAERTVAYNSEDVIYVTPPKQHFDALIQYGLAHRMPVD